MCNTRNSRRLAIGERSVPIDGCMVNAIAMLNEIGIKTLACCCGHGRYPPSIIVQGSQCIYDIKSGITIPRTRRFYLTDTDGFYYIPEVVGVPRCV